MALYNVTKKRPATPHEIAKYVLLDGACNRLIGESWGTEDLKDSKMEATINAYNQYCDSLIKRMNQTDQFENR